MELFTCIFILYNAVLCRYFQWRWIQIHFPFFGHIYCIVSIFSCEGGCNDVLFIERVRGGVGITLCLICSEFFFCWGRGLVFYCRRCFVLVAAASVNDIRGEHSIGFTIKYIHDDVHVNTWVINTLKHRKNLISI